MPYDAAVILGDGIGREVIPEGTRVMEAAAAKTTVALLLTRFDSSCETYVGTGRMMPDDGLKRLGDFDCIYLGAIASPEVPDHVSLWGLLLPIRRTFEQYVNLRPVSLFEGDSCPLAGRKRGDIDFYVVPENVEGEYSNIGGVRYENTERDTVVQQSIFTRQGIDRILQFAFDLAATRSAQRLTSATKSNGPLHSMPYWDRRAEGMASQHLTVQVEKFHIDILTANFVRIPEHLDVVVGSNLFGDILSDLGPACAGTIAPYLNSEGRYPSIFESVHGSAPDIAGRGIANSIGAIWSGAMILDHLGGRRAYDLIMAVIEEVMRDGRFLTHDMGGQASTPERGAEIARLITEIHLDGTAQ